MLDSLVLLGMVLEYFCF